MIINGFFPVFLCGAFGAFLVELLKWYRIRENKVLPHYSKSLIYWIITLLFALSGGILAALYGIKEVHAVLAINIGVSAPLIIGNLCRTIPTKEKSENENSDSIGTKNSIDDYDRYFNIGYKPTIHKFLSY